MGNLPSEIVSNPCVLLKRVRIKNLRKPIRRKSENLESQAMFLSDEGRLSFLAENICRFYHSAFRIQISRLDRD